MPWQPKDLMDIRQEFVTLALQEGANRRELCRRFGISPKTGYALLKRFASQGSAALTPRSRKPLTTPTRTAPEVEQAVVALRQQHPAWGGRKIARRPSPVACSIWVHWTTGRCRWQAPSPPSCTATA